jgi:hypothetical protein
LQTILLHPEVSLRHFPAMDILFSVRTCQPMYFRYDITYKPELCERMVNLDDAGLRWMQGIPDQFIIMLARMNMLREDFGPNINSHAISELEAEIKSYRAIADPSTDPLLTVARIAVQEAWRQAMYVYLYMVSFIMLLQHIQHSDYHTGSMLRQHYRHSCQECTEGVCQTSGRNQTSANPRYVPNDPNDHREFTLLFCVHTSLILIDSPCQVGVAARRERDREKIRQRMLSLRECSQPGTCGYDSMQVMADIWARSDAEARPAVWTDMRLAVAKVTGI